ncbi:truncated transferrin-binding protein 1 [Actinobacillus equuli]|nr:truncated transferrin-binding protein 1 [Actinobacillus equuli]
MALLVDGLPQIQSYKSISPLAQGGAINEIEYENIRSIEFSKGASSQEYGSGALGGAVGFRTKNPDDVIKEGQNWGLDSKTAYVSKINNLVNRLVLPVVPVDLKHWCNIRIERAKKRKSIKMPLM